MLDRDLMLVSKRTKQFSSPGFEEEEELPLNHL